MERDTLKSQNHYYLRFHILKVKSRRKIKFSELGYVSKSENNFTFNIAVVDL